MSAPTHAQLEFLQNTGRNFGYAVGFTAPAEHVHELQRAINAGELHLLGSSVVDIACSQQVVKEIGRPGQHEGSIILGERTKISPHSRLFGCYVENAEVRSPFLLANYSFIEKHEPAPLDPSRLRILETLALGEDSFVTFDLDTYNVHVGSTTVALTVTEFNLTHLLIAHRGSEVPLEKLYTAVSNGKGCDSLLRTHVSNAMKKLQGSGVPITCTKTRGAGYTLTLAA